MLTNEDFERLDEVYVRKDHCTETQKDIDKKLSNDNARFAILEYQQRLNNWLTTGICGGIIALLIKVFVGG